MAGSAGRKPALLFYGSNMATVTLARHAMATRFELVLHGANPVALRAAGEEALEEIERLENRLSLFRPASEIAQVNARAARQPVRVTPEVFALLQHARKMSEASGGAFDITVAPLVRCWGFHEGAGHLPRPEELAEARAGVGMALVELDPAHYTVRFAREGVMLDLGAIGKGYAIERAADLLREAGVSSALLHGGTSTIYALGRPPEREHWELAVENPRTAMSRPGARPANEAIPLAQVSLTDQALSVSAVWGKCFTAEGKVLGHVLDPRTGQPVTGALLAAVILPSATDTDALSTALLTLGFEGQELLGRSHPEMRSLVVADFNGKLEARAKGLSINSHVLEG